MDTVAGASGAERTQPLARRLARATFAMVFSGLVVQKIPFSIFNVALYPYLFLTASGSFSIKLGFLADHSGLLVLLAVGAIVLLAKKAGS